MIAVRTEAIERRDFWAHIFKTAKKIGLKPETCATIADLSLKELKARDEDPDFEW